MGDKVVIIGGGPAGLQSALTAADNGFDVTILEKSKIGENFSCAEGFFDSFNILTPPQEGVCYKVKTLYLKAKNKYEIESEDLNLWMLDRERWQKYLARMCENKGVKIKENTKVTLGDLKILKEEYDWMIDASGVFSIASKFYGIKNKQTYARAYQVRLKGDFSYLHKSLMVGVEPNFFGYYWIFPKSDHIANVGLGFFKEEDLNLKQELNKILKKEKIDRYTVIDKGGGLIPTKILDKLVFDNVILVGDSAGLASPLHGGGIDLSIISGDLAAKYICDNKTLSYENDLMKLVKQRLELEHKLVDIWSELGYEGLDEILEILLKRKNLKNIPKLFKYRNIISRYKKELNDFYNGFFNGAWPGF